MTHESNKKVLVIGAVAGGASMAARLRRLDEDANIILFEKGPDPSFGAQAHTSEAHALVDRIEEGLHRVGVKHT